MASVRKQPNGAWRARYRDPQGKEHARHFKTQREARQWLATVQVDLLRGTYCDPRAGKVTLREYAEQWRSVQPHRPSTAEQVERQLRLYVLPVLGDRPMGRIRHTDLQGLVTSLGQRLQPSTVRVVHSRLVAIFAAAVRDRIIAVSPCERIALPQRERERVVPLTPDQVWRLVDAAPERYRALVVAAAGLGLRHGELTGLAVDRVDFLRRTVRIDQQLVTVANRPPYLGPPKSTRSRRVVPLPAVVGDALAAHLAAHPAGEGGLMFTTEAGRPMSRGMVTLMWQATVARAGLPRGTRLHDLRHSYASMLIRAGESVVVVSERLGHANAAITLGVYAHMFPDDDERTRAAVDGLLVRPAADSVRTAGGG